MQALARHDLHDLQGTQVARRTPRGMAKNIQAHAVSIVATRLEQQRESLGHSKGPAMRRRGLEISLQSFSRESISPASELQRATFHGSACLLLHCYGLVELFLQPGLTPAMFGATVLGRSRNQGHARRYSTGTITNARGVHQKVPQGHPLQQLLRTRTSFHLEANRFSLEIGI